MKRKNRFVVLSGCSGGGKSTLLGELASRGFSVCEEPGRRIVKEQLVQGGDALPWANPRAFIELALEHYIADWERAHAAGGEWFFDRGVVDAANYFVRFHLPLPSAFTRAVAECRYESMVFLTPPWREIFRADAERRHGFEEAVAEYESLAAVYPMFGYQTVILPGTSVEARADFVLEKLRN